MKNKITPTDVQVTKAVQLSEIIKDKCLAILNGETRSGKTLTALKTAELLSVNDLLVITSKKAIGSIKNDHKKSGFKYKLTIINYASVHKIKRNDFDFVIIDEVHKISAFPRPAKRTKKIKDNFYKIPMLLMSGTLAAESASQYYHELWISKFSPFSKYKNFYRWADEYVNKVNKQFGTHRVTDYSGAKVNSILKIINPYMVNLTRKESGIEMEAQENDIFIDIPGKVNKLAKRLINERAIEGNDYVLMADNPASLQTKIHQIYNGSVIVESFDGEKKETIILSDYKANFISKHFKGNKLAIMYYYKSELKILKSVFGDNLTTELNEFDKSKKNIALQQNTIEGMNLSAADKLVFLNWGFSGKNYLQALTRLTVRGRDTNDVYFICENGGINSKILKSVRKKKSYNSLSFKNDFL